MNFLVEYFRKQSLKSKAKTLTFLASVFDSKAGKTRAGDGGFYKMIPMLVGVLVIGSLLLTITDAVLDNLPYVLAFFLLLGLVFRKQLNTVFFKIANTDEIKGNISHLKNKIKDGALDDNDNYAKGLVISTKVEDVSCENRMKSTLRSDAGQQGEVVATIMIQRGVLKLNDDVKVHYSRWGCHHCKVRSIYDQDQKKINTAEAGQIVSITGFYKPVIFGTNQIDIEKNPMNGKKFEAYDDSEPSGGVDAEFTASE